MSARFSAGLAWSLWTLTVVFSVLSLLIREQGSLIILLPLAMWAVTSSAVGTIIVSRRPENPIGWILCTIGFLWASNNFFGLYATGRRRGFRRRLVRPPILERGQAVHDPMITDVLRRVPLFGGLSEEQLEYVQQGNEIRLRSGDYVKRAGDPPDGFYIVIEGQIEWTSRVGQQDVYVMTLADGEFWDHELLLTDKSYPGSGRVP
jgi:hypothetical protein